MNTLHDFHPHAFDIASKESDAEYYARHRHTLMMDQGGYQAVKALYHTLMGKSDTIIDLMCGSQTPIPSDISYQNLIGIDINMHALQQNHQITQKILHDLNKDPILPLMNDSADHICLCSAVEYLRQPLLTFTECHRVLKPGGRMIISFSPHFLPTRATALWQALNNADRQKFVKILLDRTGFIKLDQGEVHPPADLPLWKDSIFSVTASKPLT